MRDKNTPHWFIFLFSVTFLFAACSGQASDAPESQAAADARDSGEEAPVGASVEETPAPLPVLSARVDLADFGFSIAHPAGWLVKGEGPNLAISETADDHENALENDTIPTTGYVIGFDHRAMPFLRSIGLPEEATLQDLLEMNASFFDWPDSLEVTETELFGAPAMAVKTTDEAGNWTHYLMGFVDEEAYLLFLVAPDEDALETYMPTWQRMLDSIEPSTKS